MDQRMHDALRFSLKREIEAMAFYEIALERVRDAGARAALAFLAEEESRHVGELRERLARSSMDEPRVRGMIDALRRAAQRIAQEKLAGILAQGSLEAIAVLRVALQEEKRSEELYKLNASTMPDVEVSTFYRGLVQEEREHVKTIKAAIRLVEKGIIDPKYLRPRGRGKGAKRSGETKR